MTAKNSRKPPEGRPFPKGVSGNPGGRPKGLAKAVREAMAADELVQGMVTIARGQEIMGQRPKLQDIVRAREWLAERGWGKPPSHAPLEDGDPLEFNELDRAISDVVDELARRRETQATRPAPDGTLEAAGPS